MYHLILGTKCYGQAEARGRQKPSFRPDLVDKRRLYRGASRVAMRSGTADSYRYIRLRERMPGTGRRRRASPKHSERKNGAKMLSSKVYSSAFGSHKL